MREDRTGINYEFSWNPFPQKFLSVRYYDHIARGELDPGGEVPFTLNLDFPTIDSNSVITHWGFSIVDDSTGDEREDVFASFGLYRCTLLINQGRVYGYSGIDHPISAFLMPGFNMSLTIGSVQNLTPLSFPITQDGSTVRIEFIDNGIPFGITSLIYGRVRGIYAIAS